MATLSWYDKLKAQSLVNGKPRNGERIGTQTLLRLAADHVESQGRRKHLIGLASGRYPRRLWQGGQ